MQQLLILLLAIAGTGAGAQELYPYTEPASNMPTGSLSLKTTAMYMRGVHTGDKILQRYMPDVMFGFSKNFMAHAGINFSNMHTPTFMWEGARVYAKYRFLSKDAVHKHFRMAAFVTGGYSRNRLDHNEINIPMGEQSGVQGGLIATQLWNKFALSGTAGWNEVLNPERWDKYYAGRYAHQSVNYSVSAGFLALPFRYTDYNQTNVNLYAELIGSRNLNFPNERYYLDLAPSVQAIFNSTAKLNVGYRFQLDGDIYRLSNKSVLVSFEYLFLNALKKGRQ